MSDAYNKRNRVEYTYWFFSIFLGFAALIVASIGVYYSFQALKSSTASVDVALQQQKTMEDQERRSLRPYLTDKSINIKTIDNTDKTKKIETSVTFANGGQTPAYKLVFKASYFKDNPVMFEETAARYKTEIEKLNPLGNLTLSKDDTYTVNNFYDTGKNVVMFHQFGLQNDVKLYLAGIATFDDTFHDHHYMHFCFQFSQDFFSTENTSLIEACPFFNDAD